MVSLLKLTASSHEKTTTHRLKKNKNHLNISEPSRNPPPLVLVLMISMMFHVRFQGSFMFLRWRGRGASVSEVFCSLLCRSWLFELRKVRSIGVGCWKTSCGTGHVQKIGSKQRLTMFSGCMIYLIYIYVLSVITYTFEQTKCWYTKNG